MPGLSPGQPRPNLNPIYIYIYIQYIYTVYNPSVSLVLCELLNVCLRVILFFVRYGFWLIVCSSFSMKCLHIDPCLCLFYPASPQHYSF